jgi:hypothetical protein
VKYFGPIELLPCVTGKLSQQWRYDSDSGHLSSVEQLTPVHGPKVRTHAEEPDDCFSPFIKLKVLKRPSQFSID